MTVRLQPWGTLTGRIVGDKGQPCGGIEHESLNLFNIRRFNSVWPADEGILPGDLRTDNDGRFRIEELVPGLKYGATVLESMVDVDVFRNVIVAPGEVKDLGDLKVVTPKTEGQD